MKKTLAVFAFLILMAGCGEQAGETLSSPSTAGPTVSPALAAYKAWRRDSFPIWESDVKKVAADFDAANSAVFLNGAAGASAAFAQLKADVGVLGGVRPCPDAEVADGQAKALTELRGLEGTTSTDGAWETSQLWWGLAKVALDKSVMRIQTLDAQLAQAAK